MGWDAIVEHLMLSMALVPPAIWKMRPPECLGLARKALNAGLVESKSAETKLK
jgi:hypothetical protein